MPYRKFYAGLIVLFLILGCRNQENEDRSLKEKDSLDYFFEKANDDFTPFEKRYLYNQKALGIISKQKNDSLNRAYHFKVAARYFNMNAMSEYKDVSYKIVKLSKKANDSNSLAKAYSFLGDYFGAKLIPDSGYHYYFKAEKIYKKLGNNVNIAKTLLYKGLLQNNEDDYIGSEKSMLDALRYLRKNNDAVIAYEANNVLGVIYSDLNEYGKSIIYHSKALEIAEKNNIYSQYQAKATSLNNIGYVYSKMNNHREAIKYFQNALKEKRIFYDKPFLYATLIDNLAYSKFKLKDLKQLPALFYEALKIRDSLNIIHGIIASKLTLSEYYAYTNDISKSLSFANQAYDLAKKSNLQKDVLLSLKQLSNIQPSKNVQYSNEYIRINDSLQLAERKIRNKLARIEFETDEIITQKNQLVEQRKVLIYIALSIILIGILIFIIRFQSSKNRELKLVQEQQKANEEIYHLMLTQQQKLEEGKQLEKKRISQELHDGVMGKLTGIRLNLFVLSRKNDQETIQKCLSHIDELKTLEQEIRDISHDLNREKTAVSSNFSLMVFSFIESQKKICQAEITFSVTPDIQWNAVDNIAKINLYRILQESFQNINKYANAKNVEVNFYKEDNSIILEIKDDGVGFNLNRRKKGIGLLNMESRIKDSNGKMEVITAPSEGTLLKFELPLKS